MKEFKEAVGVIIKQDNKYLLVQEKREDVYGLWNWPAGQVIKGENRQEAAVREAKEETGYEIKLGKEIEVFHDRPHGYGKHLFQAVIIGGSLECPADMLDVKWLTKQEIINIKDKLRTNWILDGIEILENK